MADSLDRERWQDSVDAAELLLLLSKAQASDMCSGFEINREQCVFILRRGQQLGFIPGVLEQRLRALQRLRPLVLEPA